VSETKKGSSSARLRLLRRAWQSISSKIDPSRSRLAFPKSILYSIDAASQSLLYGLQEKSFSEKLAKVETPAPIFVLGFWRSGTTLLHELLCCDLRFGFPSTYACLNPSHFLLSDSWMRKASHQEVLRPMDNLRYSWASPQEDEFALLALGAPSPYEALLVPSRMQQAREILDFDSLPVDLQKRWSCIFSDFLKLLALQQGKPMILKSPPHGYRMRVLQQQYPEARYVVIERNPYEVFASNLKLWQILTDRYGLERCTTNELEDFVLTAYLMHEKAIEESARNAKFGYIAFVRYEDLEREPVQQMSRIYKELNLGELKTVRPLWEEYLARVSGHVRNRFNLSPAQKKKVDEKWGDILAQKKYGWPEAYLEVRGDR
jgi:omega-hydroxy-beta-dihydromenaquinone-9 sulfotransferase